MKWTPTFEMQMPQWAIHSSMDFIALTATHYKMK